jgi:hypothetical protein
MRNSIVVIMYIIPMYTCVYVYGIWQSLLELTSIIVIISCCHDMRNSIVVHGNNYILCQIVSAWETQ